MFGNKKNKSQANLFEVAQVGLMIYGTFKDIEIRDKLLKSLDENPLSPNAHNAFLEGIKQIKNPTPTDITNQVYFRALSILLNNPDNNDVINFVMNVGKWHYASHKPAKEYTVNDLQFIQSQLAEIQKLKLLSNHLKHENALVLCEAIQISENFKIEELNIYSAPSDPVAKKYIEEKIEFLEHLINFLIKQIEINPIDKKLQDALIASLKKHPSIEHTRIYQSILNIFESSVNQQGLKILVLEVGRWHFGRQRFWGKANANDEQTIQNDILVRTRNN